MNKRKIARMGAYSECIYSATFQCGFKRRKLHILWYYCVCVSRIVLVWSLRISSWINLLEFYASEVDCDPSKVQISISWRITIPLYWLSKQWRAIRIIFKFSAFIYNWNSFFFSSQFLGSGCMLFETRVMIFR